MNNRHRRVARLKKEVTARQLLAEIASLISRRYGVTAEESARQIQVMIKTNSISFETLDKQRIQQSSAIANRRDKMVPKFRCWDEPNKTMRFNDEIVIWRGQVYINEKKELDAKIKGFSCLPEYLMQSTGLKDKNGVEIFEGDVVQWGDTLGGEETPIRIATVKIEPDILFDSNVGIFNYGQFAYKNTEKFLTILGNIYENPELLEVE